MAETIKRYIRRVAYHETDQMGILHHSNYIRWMEEARIDFMRQAGIDCAALERDDILMPVVFVNCRYKISLRFDEEAAVETTLTVFNGARVEFAYRVLRLADGALSAEGESGHCFVDRETRLPLSLKRRAPEAYARGMELLNVEGRGEEKI